MTDDTIEDKKDDEVCEICGHPTRLIISKYVDADGRECTKAELATCRCTLAERAIYKLLKEIRDAILPPPRDPSPPTCPYIYLSSGEPAYVGFTIPENMNVAKILEHDWCPVEAPGRAKMKCKKCGMVREDE